MKITMSKKGQKSIKDRRCKYMPAKPNTVVIFSSKHGDNYKAGFTIGNQDFTVVGDETKEDAQWFCDRLEEAFKNLIHNRVEDLFKSEGGKAAIRKMSVPKIHIINKR